MIRVLFVVGDCAAGALTAIATTVAVRSVVSPGSDMVVAMLLGMALGTAVHVLLSVIFTPLLGMFETMVPGMYIGMYGGMLFGMRDSMQQVLIATDLLVATVLGVAIVLGVHFWNAQLRRQEIVYSIGRVDRRPAVGAQRRAGEANELA